MYCSLTGLSLTMYKLFLPSGPIKKMILFYIFQIIDDKLIKTFRIRILLNIIDASIIQNKKIIV